MGFLSGKRVLILGLLSNRSIAYGIAKACHAQGAELAFTYQNERFETRVKDMAAEFGSSLAIACDVAEDAQISAALAELSKTWSEGFDGLVHAIGFAPRESIAGQFLDGASREAFRIAHDISAYSFVELAKQAQGMMRPAVDGKGGHGGSMLTLTYHGSQQVIPNYNTMGLAKASLEASVRYLASDLGPKGIRVNGISAGPIKTLAASGIKGFGKILNYVEKTSPIRRNVSLEDVGNVAAFLLSPLAAGMSAEIVYVDGGFSHVVGGMDEPASEG